MTNARAVSAPWLTGADLAEQQLLVRELVDGVFSHRERCELCRAGGGSCRTVRDAIEAMIEWRDRRSLRSLVVALRARQDFTDWRAA